MHKLLTAKINHLLKASGLDQASSWTSILSSHIPETSYPSWVIKTPFPLIKSFTKLPWNS